MSLRIIGAGGEAPDPRAFIERAAEVFRARGLQAQVVDARFVADRAHAVLAYRQAQRRHERGRAISRSLSMEFLLYLAGTHQIEVAIRRLGIRPDTRDILIMVLEGPEDLRPEELLTDLGLRPLEGPVFAQDLGAVMEAFEVPPALADGTDPDRARKAVYEAVSLVNLEK